MSDATTVYRLLAAKPRRDVLFALCEADSVRVSEAGTRRDDPFELQLYHNHLPKLAETGLVAWDRDAGVVSRGAAFPDVRRFVERVRESERELLDRPSPDSPPETGTR